MIIMFIGPSSSGKDFFYEKTLKKYDFNEIILLTTRPKRVNEVEGKEYYFIDNETMDQLDKNGNLIERRDYETVNGIWSYATRGDNINLDENYLVINTWEAYKSYIDYFGKDVVYPFYFELDPNIRFERAYEREKKQEKKNYLEMCRRFIADNEDFTDYWIEKYNPIIINNDGTVEETEKQIDNNIKKLIKK